MSEELSGTAYNKSLARPRLISLPLDLELSFLATVLSRHVHPINPCYFYAFFYQICIFQLCIFIAAGRQSKTGDRHSNARLYTPPTGSAYQVVSLDHVLRYRFTERPGETRPGMYMV